jgi:hypothetical protein
MMDKEQELIDAIVRLTDKLDSVSNSVGRGSQSSNTPKNGPVPRAKAADPAEKANREEVKKASKAIKDLGTQTKAGTKAAKEALEAQADLTKEQKEAKRVQERTTDAFKNFGETLIGENANLSSAFSRLGSNLEYTGSTFGKFAGGIAAGVGFMLGNLQEFAKNAGDMGAFADLGKFRVGSVTQMKLMSGLGSSFMKVIEDSQGGFKAFGTNSQEAAENLSNLSRGLKYGSFYLNSTLRDALGKDLTKSVNRASRAAAAMGLTDEERAKLIGSIAQSSTLAAKNEQDAQQRLVKQYADTLDNTRKLSNAFGVSSKEILAAMAEFRKTTAGTYASLEGNTAAQNLVPLIKSMGIESDPEKISKIALALSRGELGQALPNVSNRSAVPILEMLNRAVEAGGEGGNNVEAINKNLRSMTGEMQQLSAERSQYATTASEYATPGAVLGAFAKRLETGNKDEGKEEPRTSETDNIMAMNSLTAALESLRNVLLGVTAGIATLVGSLGALVVAGGIGGLMSGGLGKVGDMLGGALGKVGGMFGKKPDFVGPMKPSAGSAVMDKLSGAASKGMEGFGDLLGNLGESKTVKGAATLALLGSALALTAVGLKTFNEVNWTSLVKGTIALGGLIGMARLVGEATTGIVKGAAAIAILGAAVALSAIGFKTFNDVNWDSLIKGAGAIAILGVGAQLLGKMTGSILMGALAITALGAAMWVAGKGFQTFNDLNWEGIAKGAVALGVFAVTAGVMGGFLPVIAAGALAITVLGGALAVFGAGAWVAAQAADVFAGALEKIGKVDGVNLIAIGAGLAAIGAGAVVFAAGMVAATATSLVTGLMGLFGAKSPMERILELVPVADKIGMIGEGMFKFGTGIGLINENLKSLDLEALDKFKNVLIEMSNINIPSLDGLSIPQISTEGIAGMPQQGSGLANVLNGNSAVTPEVIGQLMSYLSNIENDLAAIRGNTKQAGYESPVRLS